MKIYDITIPISPSLPTFPGDPQVQIEVVTSVANGDPANVSRIVMSSHSGTHIDVPRHFDDLGLPVDRLPLDQLMGNALVADLRGIVEVNRDVLSGLPLNGVKRLLLRTDNSLLWDREGFVEDYAHVTIDGAEYLLEAGVRLVGIDFLSIEAFRGNGDVHRLLLENGAIILEGLNLAGVEQGRYELICLPLKLSEGDGAPVRAVLRSIDP